MTHLVFDMFASSIRPFRYSVQSVQARHMNDGSVIPVTQPKLLPNGEYQRPIGRQRKGMDWDPVRGVWIPDRSNTGS